MKTNRHYLIGAAASALLLMQMACGPSATSTPEARPAGTSAASLPVATPTEQAATATPVVTSTAAPTSTLTPVPTYSAKTPSFPQKNQDGSPTREDMIKLQVAFNFADLGIAVIASPDPAIVGEELVYTLTVSNRGPNLASGTQVVDMLPLGVSYLSDNFGCIQEEAGKLVCDLGLIWPPDQVVIIITVLVDAEALVDEGETMTIINEATVVNLSSKELREFGYASLVFPDSDPTNNSVSLETLVTK